MTLLKTTVQRRMVVVLLATSALPFALVALWPAFEKSFARLVDAGKPAVVARDGVVGVAMSDFESSYLRSAEDDAVKIAGLAGWGQVYEVMRTLGYSAKKMEAVILMRLAVHFGWTDKECGDLARLLAEEREAFTQQAIARYGLNPLYSVLDRPKQQRVQFLQLLQTQREALRRRFDQKYAKSFDFKERAMINEHLRSAAISLMRSSGDKTVTITGVGSLAFTDVGKQE